MQIGGASSYFAPTPFSAQARVPSPSASPETSPDLSRAAQAPATPAPSLGDEQAPSGREEADKNGEPAAQADKGKEAASNPQAQRLEQLEVAKLVRLDQEVRTHEQAHAAVGGRYAGAPSYTYATGPDGKRYAVGGEVSIDSGAIPGNPEATLRKMEVVLRAALAPAEPSAQDLQVAAQAQAQMVQSRADLAAQQRTEVTARAEKAKPEDEPGEPVKSNSATESAASPASARSTSQSPSALDLYRRTGEASQPTPLIDFVA
ncbi:putative metalloprotease CJM1_0395 family protein [Pseudomonas borbori]